jgi:hypothetical protein
MIYSGIRIWHIGISHTQRKGTSMIWNTAVGVVKRIPVVGQILIAAPIAAGAVIAVRSKLRGDSYRTAFKKGVTLGFYHEPSMPLKRKKSKAQKAKALAVKAMRTGNKADLKRAQTAAAEIGVQ